MIRSTVKPWIGMGAWYLRPRRSRIAQIAQRLDRFVLSWERLLSRSGANPPPLIFTHIPKTGGTTLSSIVARNYPPNAVVHINSPTLHRNPAALFKTGAMPRVVMGHHGLSQALYRFIDRNTAHLTMLRDPVARIVSYFHYLKTSESHILHGRVKSMTLGQFAESNLSTELDNGQAMRLSGFQRRRPGRPLISDDEAAARAIETLEKRISLFGITGRYTEFLIMCRTVMPWRDVFCERRNVSERADADDSVLDESAIAAIRARNGADIALYEFASDLFDRRCDELGIDHEDIRAFGEINARYTELLRGHLPAHAAAAG